MNATTQKCQVAQQRLVLLLYILAHKFVCRTGALVINEFMHAWASYRQKAALHCSHCHCNKVIDHTRSQLGRLVRYYTGTSSRKHGNGCCYRLYRGEERKGKRKESSTLAKPRLPKMCNASASPTMHHQASQTKKLYHNIQAHNKQTNHHPLLYSPPPWLHHITNIIYATLTNRPGNRHILLHWSHYNIPEAPKKKAKGRLVI